MRIVFWRSFYFLVNPFRRMYWRMVQPKTRGVKVVAVNADKFLLVKIAYGGKYWTFPGGGVRREESYEQAAERELFEETGIQSQELKFIGQYESKREGKRDTVQCFSCVSTHTDLRIDSLEISEAGWFPAGSFPQDRSASVDKVWALVAQTP